MHPLIGNLAHIITPNITLNIGHPRAKSWPQKIAKWLVNLWLRISTEAEKPQYGRTPRRRAPYERRRDTRPTVDETAKIRTEPTQKSRATTDKTLVVPNAVSAITTAARRAAILKLAMRLDS